MINNWFIQEEEHCHRFFKTKWNSRISLLRWKKKEIKEFGLKFKNGYCEFVIGNWKLRYRNGK